MKIRSPKYANKEQTYMVVDHPAFKQPKDGRRKLWRYMDIAKFLSMLNYQELYFARSDTFEDPFEGAATEIDIAYSDGRWNEFVVYCQKEGFHIPQVVPSAKDSVYPFFRKFVAINCWHENQFESAAMWDLYCDKSQGIAVVSSWDRLRESIHHEQEVFIGRVKYIDRTKHITDENAMNFYLQKRKSFEHEREVRAVLTVFPTEPDPEMLTRINTDVDTINGGIAIKVSLARLIDCIYVAPMAPKWHYNLIKDTMLKYGFNFKVIQSNLYLNLR